MSEKKFKQVCECKHCGSEAGMMITCTLAEDLPQEAAFAVVPEVQGKTKGQSVSPNRLSLCASLESSERCPDHKVS